MFSKKGDKVVEVNIQALNEGYQLMQSQALPETDGDSGIRVNRCTTTSIYDW